MGCGVAAAHDGARDRAGVALLAVGAHDVGQLALGHLATRSAAERSCEGSMRMSSGAWRE